MKKNSTVATNKNKIFKKGEWPGLLVILNFGCPVLRSEAVKKL
jgi:hypothetical protein